MNETIKGPSTFQPIVLPNQCPKAAEGQVGRSGDKGQVPSERTDIQGDGQAHGQRLQPGDERAYPATAQAILANVTWMLTPFDASFSQKTAKEAGSLDKFCEGFLDRGEQFMERCCADCAKIMRQCAVVPEVRGTPTVLLAKEIRQAVFPPMEEWLADGRASLIAESCRREALSFHEALLIKDQKSLHTLDVGREQPWAYKLLVMGINQVNDRAKCLLDYALAESFGGRLSLEARQSAWSAIQQDISEEVGAAIAMTRQIPRGTEKTGADDPQVQLHPGDERAYGATAQAIRANLTWLLIPLDSSFSAKTTKETSSLIIFCGRFLDRIEQFVERCCEDCAEIMRQCAVRPEVRGTPTASLAAEIRKEVFEPLDRAVMAGRDFIPKVADYQWRASLKSLTSEESAHFQSKVPSLLPLMITASIKEANEHAERILDYTLAKTFGGQVSLERQQRAWTELRESIAKEVDTALRRVPSRVGEKSVAELEESKKAAVTKLEALLHRAGALEKEHRGRIPFGRKLSKAARTVVAMVLVIPGALAALVAGVCAIGGIYSLFDDPSVFGVFFRYGGAGLVVAVVCFAVAGLIKPEKPLPEQIAAVEKEISALDAKIAELAGQASTSPVQETLGQPLTDKAKDKTTEPGTSITGVPGKSTTPEKRGGGSKAVLPLMLIAAVICGVAFISTHDHRQQPTASAKKASVEAEPPPKGPRSRMTVFFATPVDATALETSNYVILGTPPGGVPGRVRVYSVHRLYDSAVELTIDYIPRRGGGEINLQIGSVREASGAAVTKVDLIKTEIQ